MWLNFELIYWKLQVRLSMNNLLLPQGITELNTFHVYGSIPPPLILGGVLKISDQSNWGGGDPSKKLNLGGGGGLI